MTARFNGFRRRNNLLVLHCATENTSIFHPISKNSDRITRNPPAMVCPYRTVCIEGSALYKEVLDPFARMSLNLLKAQV